VLGLLLGLSAGMAPAQDITVAQDTVSKAKQLTRTLIQQLAAGEFEAVTARFDTTMRDRLPPAQLQMVWAGLEGQYGAFQRSGNYRHMWLSNRNEFRERFKGLSTQEARAAYRERPPGDTIVVLARCYFEQDSLDLRASYRLPEFQQIGLFVSPAGPQKENPLASGYKLPNYADTSAYVSQAVAIPDSGRPSLPGTLTLPRSGEARFPLVILVHGSGPNDRDETIGPNKIFKDIASGLASRGIAVLRYDKRSHARPDAMKQEAYTLWDVTNRDVMNALRRARKHPALDTGRIFLLGHSLGGNQLPRVARRAQRQGIAPRGLILMNANTEPLYEAAIRQLRYLQTHDTTKPIPDQLIQRAKRQAERVRTGDFDSATARSDLPLSQPPAFWRDLKGYEPTRVLQATQLPTLVLQGGRDYQVRKQDYQEWCQALKANQQPHTCRSFERLNHLMLPGQGRSLPAEYRQPGHVPAQVIRSIRRFVRAYE
jgi:alpha-beta hydrolase superfamily lysophospholipase